MHLSFAAPAHDALSSPDVPGQYDVLVVGAGPNGLATALWAQKKGLKTAIVERGRVAENIAHFPLGMVFFLGRAATEIGGIPIDSKATHPTREDALSYLRRVAALSSLEVHTGCTFERLTGSAGDFGVIARKDGAPIELRTRNVVLATGVYGQPKRLGVPGEELPKVGYGYRDPYDYAHQDVLIAGAGNGAAEAALRMHHEAGARVTVLNRDANFSANKWRWRVADIAELVSSGAIRVVHGATLELIEPAHVTISSAAGRERLPNDRVVVIAGYRPDLRVFEAAGVAHDRWGAPQIDPRTLETNVKGVYAAGAICAGEAPDLVLIAGGRNHGRAIVAHLLGEPPPVEDRGPKTLEHWLQFHRFSQELPRELVLKMVPVVTGEHRDNLLDLYHRKLLGHQAELERAGELTSQALWGTPIHLGAVIDELSPAELSPAGDGMVSFKGRRLPEDALEILRLADGSRSVAEIIREAGAAFDGGERELEDQVVGLIVSLLESGRLNWRAEPISP